MILLKNNQVDVNCDLGEGLDNESLLMPYISSCNIACGGHAGDAQTMVKVLRLAKQHQVLIGAHPSFPDPEHFGRKPMDLSPSALTATLITQIETLQTLAEAEGLSLNHIKPHGALYNLAAQDEQTAQAVIKAVSHCGAHLKLYAPYGSVIAQLALASGLEVVFEAFADRHYNEDLSLVSRSNPEALILEPKAVFEQVNHILKTGQVASINGVEVKLKAQTFCVHGDHQNALEILDYLDHHLMLKSSR